MYKVEHNYSYGWDDAGWYCGELPMVYENEEQALEDIDDLVESMNEQFELGNVSEQYYKEQYRIVEVI